MSLTSYRAAPPRDGGGPYQTQKCLIGPSLTLLIQMDKWVKLANGFFLNRMHDVRRLQCLATTYSSNA